MVEDFEGKVQPYWTWGKKYVWIWKLHSFIRTLFGLHLYRKHPYPRHPYLSGVRTGIGLPTCIGPDCCSGYPGHWKPQPYLKQVETAWRTLWP